MFELLAEDPQSKARRARLTTAHGVIDTPAFLPVGTQGSVKAVSPRELRELNAQIVLGNTYHLFVRPGLDVINHFGGLHKFMNWEGPILTDNGGYQIFSLAKLRKITEDGVEFQNRIDGTRAFISPEMAMEIQATLGSASFSVSSRARVRATRSTMEHSANFDKALLRITKRATSTLRSCGGVWRSIIAAE